MRTFGRRHPNIAVSLVAAAALLAACGGDDEDKPVACAWASCANDSPVGAAAGSSANPASPAGNNGGAAGNGTAVAGNTGGSAGDGPTNGGAGSDSSGAAGAPTDGSGGAAPMGGTGGDPQGGSGDPQAGSGGDPQNSGGDRDAGMPPDDPMPDAGVDPDPDPPLADYTLIVEAPADGASVTGVVKVTGRATAFLNVELWDAMHQMPPLGQDVPDANGRFEITIDTAALSTGATTWTVHAWDSPPGTSFDNTKNVRLDLTITRPGDPGGGGESTPDPGTKWVPAGYTLAFSDEFDGSSLDTGKWNTLAPWGVQFFEDSKQKQAFVPQAVSVHDGVVTFTANRSNGASNANGQPYVSGSITTNRTFTHGYFETRARVPAGKGFWPAYWLTSSTRWPPEWDIFEIIDNVIYGYPHPISSGKCQFVEGAAGSDSTYTIPNLYGIYHVYGLRWTATDVWWWVDGVLTEHYAVDAAAGANDPYWLNISLQVGGDWPGDPDGTTPFPGKMDVDYMRVYE